MIGLVVRRLLLTLPVLWGVSTLTFLLLHFIPGDPIDVMLGPQAAEADKARLRQELHLNDPLLTQYSDFMAGLLRGNLGRSLTSKRPVASEIFNRVGATFELSFAAVGFSIFFGIPFGVLAARRRSDKVHSVISSSATFWGWLGMSLPGFVLGPLLIMFFAIRLDWLPVSERGGFSHVILPALSLGIGLSAILMRMTRAAVVETLNEDYIRTALAKGASPSRVYFKHALRNALMPIITIVGLQFGALLTGTVVTETIFDWPGIGSLFYSAIQSRNYPLVQGCVLFISLVYVFVNLATDIAYGMANPKVRAL